MNFSFCYRKPCVKAASYNMSPFLYLRYTSGLDYGAWDLAITFQKLQGFNLTLYPGFFFVQYKPTALAASACFLHCSISWFTFSLVYHHDKGKSTKN